MSIVLSSAALSRLVLVHDCHDTNIESLTEVYAGKSLGEIEDGLRWFYCAGMGIALASMGKYS
jgi:hypothetical protein